MKGAHAVFIALPGVFWAVVSAHAGTVHVAPGTYRESPCISKNEVILRGANAVISAGVQPGARGSESVIVGGIEIFSSTVTVDGFLIRNGGVFSHRAGIYVHQNTDGHFIANNILVGYGTDESGGTGISIGSHSTNIHIVDNEFTNWFQGAFLGPAENIYFIGNNIHDNLVGIDSEGITNSILTENDFVGNILAGWNAVNSGVEIIADLNRFVRNGIGLAQQGGNPIKAIRNWWGEASGPQHSAMNPSGLGQSVSGDVDLYPWAEDDVAPLSRFYRPIAQSQNVSTEENVPVEILLTGEDADGDSTAFIVVDLPSHGSLSGIAPKLTYTPGVNYSGWDSFTFKVNDGDLDSDIAEVTIAIIGQSPTPTWTATNTPTATPNSTNTSTNTPTLTPTPSLPTPTPTYTPAPSETPSPTFTPPLAYEGPVAGEVQFQIYRDALNSDRWISMSDEERNRVHVPAGSRSAFRVTWQTVPDAELRPYGGIYDPAFGSGYSEIEGEDTETVVYTLHFTSNPKAAGKSTTLRMGAVDRYLNYSEVPFLVEIVDPPVVIATSTPTITPLPTAASIATSQPTNTSTVSPTSTPTSTAIATLSPTPTLTSIPTTAASAGAQLLLSQGHGGSSSSNRRDAATLRIISGSAFSGLPSRFAEGIQSPRWRSANTAVADIDGDGKKEIVVGFGPGGFGASEPSIITVWKTDPLSVMTSKGVFSTIALNPLLRNPHGSLNVCVGYFTDTFIPQVIAAQGLGGGNQIRVIEFTDGRLRIVGTFQGLTREAVWGNRSGGTSVAAGDLDGDGLDELVVGQMNGKGATTLFQVIDLKKENDSVSVQKRTAPVPGMPGIRFIGEGGVNLAVGDVDGDGDRDIVVASAGLPDGAGNSQLKNFICVHEVATDNRGRITTIRRLTPVIQVLGDTVNPSGGIDVAVGNLDDDPVDEIVVGTQAITLLAGDDVTLSHPAPASSIRGYKLEFGKNGAYIGFRPLTPRIQVFDGEYAPGSGAVNVGIY